MLKAQEIVNELERMYPDAHCELNHQNNFELLISIILSAQTTDKSVNLVTPTLFLKYPTIEALSEANYQDVLEILKTLGLAKTKAHNIIKCAERLRYSFNSKIPETKEELTSLPGVGVKTANVFMAVGLGIQAFGVDTHVLRVSNHLKITKSDNPLVVEKDLVKFFKGFDFIKLHHQFIFFGRYFCKARNPLCEECPFKNDCKR